MARPAVALNGRFLRARANTGVQRYARALLERLPQRLGSESALIVPGLPTREVGLPSETLRPLNGAVGHLWEQAVLPWRARGYRLLSLCNFAPVTAQDSVVVIHDASAWSGSEWFHKSYGRGARLLQGAVAQSARAVVTVSHRSRGELLAALPLDPERVHVVAPGVGAPFLTATTSGSASHFLFVGGHDPRKNLPFVLDLWERYGVSTDLVVVARRSATVLRHVRYGSNPNVHWIWDPSDARLVELYRHAHALLWPSYYEGFGLPLLEAMACATPFVATDVGAARELAVDPDLQIVPLNPALWYERLRTMQEGRPDLTSACRGAARHRTWDVAASQLTNVLLQA